MKSQGFDRVAKFYDALAWIVFGKSIRNAQMLFLDHIHPGSKVIIIGGGTGWILECIRQPCEIWYVEKSSAMIQRTKRRNTKNIVHFIHGTSRDVQHIAADVVITNFFLDLFENDLLREEVDRISTWMLPKGSWLITDFVDGEKKWWHHSMLVVMYYFFRLTCGLATRTLPDWEGTLTTAGWNVEKRKYFYRGFIKSEVRTRVSDTLSPPSDG